MARQSVIPFEDHDSHPELKRVIPPTDPLYPAIRRRLWITWGKTIAGYLAMVALVLVAMWGLGVTPKFTIGNAIWSFVLPLVMWWNCARIALWMQKAVPADPNNPDHKRVIDCVDRVYEKSGMKFKPPVYCAPNPLPNAFATGPIHRKAVVAFTEGLLKCGMTDAEIEAVFAHELGHVRNYDVAINSFLGMISSIFFLVVNGFVSTVVMVSAPLRWLAETIKIGWVFNILTNILWWGVYQITGNITRLVQFFVVRSRESGADATGAYMTGKPCDLATALQKLVCYSRKNQPKAAFHEAAFLDVLRSVEMMRALRLIMTVDPLFDVAPVTPAPTSWWGQLKAFWRSLQLTHPPVPERVAELEKMNNGAKCPSCGC